MRLPLPLPLLSLLFSATLLAAPAPATTGRGRSSPPPSSGPQLRDADAARPVPLPPPPAPLPPCPGPPVELVIAASLELAHLEPEQAASWRRRLPWSSLIPRLTSRVGQDSFSGELVGLRTDTADRLNLNNYLAIRYEFRATWDLSRLVFDPRELRVSSRGSKLAAERQQLTERVVRLYFERCRLLLLSRTRAEHSAEQALRDELELRRVTALLDALSGGLLSRGAPR